MSNTLARCLLSVAVSLGTLAYAAHADARTGAPPVHEASKAKTAPVRHPFESKAPHAAKPPKATRVSHPAKPAAPVKAPHGKPKPVRT